MDHFLGYTSNDGCLIRELLEMTVGGVLFEVQRLNRNGENHPLRGPRVVFHHFSPETSLTVCLLVRWSTVQSNGSQLLFLPASLSMMLV